MTITDGSQDALLDRRKRGGEWGVTAAIYAGDSIVEFLNAHPEVKTILDYGCGEGTLKPYVESQGIDRSWTLYDPGIPEYQTPPKGKFDLVITTDVLEHVEPHMQEAVLDDLRRLTGKYLFNETACYLTGRRFDYGPYIGQDLHINLRAPDDWAMQLAHKSMNLIKNKVSLTDGFKVRHLSIQEVKRVSYPVKG